jgi:hypothetical protein
MVFATYGVGDCIGPVVGSGEVINSSDKHDCGDCILILLPKVFQHLGLLHFEGKYVLCAVLNLLLNHLSSLVTIKS